MRSDGGMATGFELFWFSGVMRRRQTRRIRLQEKGTRLRRDESASSATSRSSLSRIGFFDRQPGFQSPEDSFSLERSLAGTPIRSVVAAASPTSFPFSFLPQNSADGHLIRTITLGPFQPKIRIPTPRRSVVLRVSPVRSTSSKKNHEETKGQLVFLLVLLLLLFLVSSPLISSKKGKLRSQTHLIENPKGNLYPLWPFS